LLTYRTIEEAKLGFFDYIEGGTIRDADIQGSSMIHRWSRKGIIRRAPGKQLRICSPNRGRPTVSIIAFAFN
jgi:hypothetical protein